MENRNKKQRTTNFKPNEEEILVSLVKKYENVVESRKSDSIMNSEKWKTWEKIAYEFNGILGENKSASCLRTKFNNMKKQAKKKFADEKVYTQGTGGGPPPKLIKVTDTENVIRDILGNTLTGYPSEFDGDCNEIEIEYVEGIYM